APAPRLARTSGRHALAFLGAGVTGPRARLAMLVFMASALVGAGAARLRAYLAQGGRLLAVAEHERGAQPAQVRAITIQLNTAGHHRHILFAQAGGGATLAGFGTTNTSLDTGLVDGIDHRRSSRANRPLLLNLLRPPPPTGVLVDSTLPDGNELGRVQLRRGATLALDAAQIDEADDLLALGHAEAGLHHRVVGQVATAPDGPQPQGMGGDDDGVGGAAGGQDLLALRHLEVRLRRSDHRHQQGRPQRHGAGLAEHFRLAARRGDRLGEQLAQLLARFALD